MQALGDLDILRIWEWGQARHPVDRALLILAVACPDASRDELAALSIGRRDQRLLKIRESTLGRRMRSYAVCPHCGEQLEFELDTARLAASEEPAATQDEHTLEAGGYVIHHRLINSRDLAAVVGEQEPATVRDALLGRCVLAAEHSGEATAVSQLPTAVIDSLDTELERLDPHACVRLEMQCAECGHDWQTTFDITTYFWTELCHRARRLLWEVDALARAYGWSETEILTISRTRRREYLELIS